MTTAAADSAVAASSSDTIGSEVSVSPRVDDIDDVDEFDDGDGLDDCAVLYHKMDTSRFNELWLRLPTELQTFCFDLLDLVDLLAVSHASRRLRTHVLQAPALWNVLTEDDPQHTGLLAAMFERSKSLPFHLHLLDKVSDYVADLVARNLHRIATLDVMCNHLTLVKWMALPAPMLRVAGFESLWISPGWGSLVPLLHKLEVNYIHSIPAGIQPITSLRRLCMGVDSLFVTHVDLTRLPDAFPLLEGLNLHDIHERTVLPVKLPTSVHSVSLHFAGDDDVMIKALPVLSAWIKRPSLAEITIACEERLLPIIEFFNSIIDNTSWKMVVTGVKRLTLSLVTLERQVCRVYVTIREFLVDSRLSKPPHGRFYNAVLDSLPSLSNLVALSISATLLGFFSLPLAFPGLTSLTIEEPFGPILRKSSNNLPAISAPKLRRLVINCEGFPMYVQAHTSVPSMFSEFDNEKLECVTIASTDVETFDQCNWTQLLERTNELRLEDPTTHAILRLLPPPPC